MKNTFVTQSIYKITCAAVSSEQYEEQWRLIFAEDEQAAIAEAKNIALKEEAVFIDRHGREICWKFIAIKDIKPVKLENGALLSSSIKELEPVLTHAF